MSEVTTDRRVLPLLSIILSAVLSSASTFAAASSCPPLNFKVAPAFPAGTNPRSLAVADFDADGNPDVAVANHGSNNVSVLRGDGAGRFAAPLNTPVGVNPYSVAAGDFNGDGRPDLLTANHGSASVSVLLNNGGGAFGAAAGAGVRSSPRSVAVADFNGDGKTDAAVGHVSPGSVSILLGAGDGSFAAPSEIFVTMSGVHDLLVGDFNGDGRADIFSLHGQSDEVSVLLGDGAGRFAAPKLSVGGSAAGSAAAADIDGDGKLDVVIAYSQPTSQGWASLMLGDGVGGFARPVRFDAGGNPLGAAVADFDGDGKPDVAIANDISSSVSVFSNVGAGTNTFAPARNYGVGTDPRALAVGDFNKDGRPDLASANYSSNNVSVMLNAGGGDFFANRNVAVVRSPWDSTAADFNGDGNLDFAAANRGEGVVSLMLGQGVGGLAPPASVSAPGTSWIAHADFNNDGKLDLALTAGGALVSVLLGDGAGGFGAARLFSTVKGTGALACGDFNADGKADIVVTLPGKFTVDPGGIAVLLGDGAGGFGAAHVQDAGPYPKDVAVGDFNGDGRADFAVVNDLSPSVSLFTPDAEGRYPFKVFSAGSDNGRVSMETVAVGDFDADGKADVAAAASVQGSDSFVAVALGDGAGRLGPLNRHAVGPGNPYVTTGDFDGDGRLDLATANRSFEKNNVAVLVGDGAGGFAPSLNFSVGRLSSSAAAGDFDKDGRTDLAVVNSSAHDVSLIYNLCPAAPASNPVDDSQFFVAQHYRDFLGREPDAGGLAFWTAGIESCGADQQCRALKRIDTSAAFFLSIEFQETGFLVHRMYKAAFGEADGTAVINNVPTTIKVPVVRLSEFTPDSQRIAQDVIVGTPGWPERLTANKDAFALEFVQRPRFTTAYPSDMTPEAFVDKLNTNASDVLSAGERQALIDELTANNNGAGRASVLRKVAEDAELAAAERNKAFVLMQYFGYLRRNPNDPQDTDHGGYNFWLQKLNDNGGDYHAAQMVFAFLDSIEYRDRFVN